MTTTLQGLNPTVSLDNRQTSEPPTELCRRYETIVNRERFGWTAHHHLIKPLGRGGQGVVFLSEQRGADGFTLPVAIKVFSPERFEDHRSYDAAMARMAHVAARVAQIQQDNLLNVHNFYDRDRIRMMVMEWVDGYDLRALLCNDMLAKMRHRVSATRWEYINRVIITDGELQPRIKPGVAVAIVRDCLAALAALHRGGIVHGDIKPANIMLKRTGNAKTIDIGSAFELNDPPASRSCTPRYVAPEILDGKPSSPSSDVASLGYVLIELLSGEPIFAEITQYQHLLEAKRVIGHRLEEILPKEVTCNDLLMNFCRRLVAQDPNRRFSSAEVADYMQGGAAAFHRQLVISNLASEYEGEIRLWMEIIHDMNEAKREDEAE